MTTPTDSKSFHARASSIPGADEAMSATSQALESTRQFAGEAIEKTGEKFRDLRSGVKDLASKSAATVGEATAVAQKQLGRYARATERYISDEPVKAALIAAALGAAVAALILAMRRSRRRY